MFYITGENDTLITLKQKDNFQGSLDDFGKTLLAQNPHLSFSSLDGKLPSMTPILLTEEGEASPELKGFVRELRFADKKEIEVLAQFQEHSIDIPTLVALNTIMEEVQEYSHRFRDFFDEPLISTPWASTNFIDRTSIFDLLKGGSGIAAGTIYRRNHVFALDELYEAICRRDVLNREIYTLQRASKGIHFNEITRLKKLASEQTATIKRLLPKRLDDVMSRYLNRKGLNIHRLRNNSYSLKMARKGKATTLNLDFLNKIGLSKAQKMIGRMTKLGATAEKGSVYLGPALVAYDTAEAYKNKEDWGKVLVSGSAGVATGFAMGAMASTAEWGAISIGVLAGDAALGGAILAFSPVWGVALAVVVGVVVIGYATYKASGFVEELWESDTAKQLRHELGTKLEQIWEFFKSTWDHDHHLAMYDM